MKKEFIPYEQSLELKELGFDEPCFGVYLIQSKEFVLVGSTERIRPKSKNFNAPLYQQAFRWFREKYGYDVSIKKRKFEIQKLEIYGESDPDYYFTDFPFDSYEESELKCLKKLIEIVKNK